MPGESARLQFRGFAHANYYDGRGGRWAVGDVKIVSREDAERLLADFGEVFGEAVEESVAPPAAALPAQPSEHPAPPPPKRKGRPAAKE